MSPALLYKPSSVHRDTIVTRSANIPHTTARGNPARYQHNALQHQNTPQNQKPSSHPLTHTQFVTQINPHPSNMNRRALGMDAIASHAWGAKILFPIPDFWHTLPNTPMCNLNLTVFAINITVSLCGEQSIHPPDTMHPPSTGPKASSSLLTENGAWGGLQGLAPAPLCNLRARFPGQKQLC